MSANAVIAGSLAEVKFVKSRSVCVLCVEIPIEQAEDAIAKFGIPLPGQEIPVALARLQMPAASEAPRETRVEQDIASGTNDTKSPARSEAAKLSYAMKDKMAKAATRAVMLCADPRFCRWVEKKYEFAPNRIGDSDTCADFLRRILFIKSRSEIAGNEDAFQRFLALELSYQQAVGLAASPR